ncbi:MAG: hypothetical protein Hals2KO_14690 [Halioglobus sp.]
MIGSTKGSEIIESDTVFTHHIMGRFRGELPDIESFTHDKMVDTMSASKIKAEQMEGPEIPCVKYLRLRQHRVDATVIVHV